MASFIIEGGHRLQGDIMPQGAKNEALQVLCALLLTNEPVRIKNLPDIADVNNQIQLLHEMGVEVTRHDAHDYTFTASSLDDQYLSSEAYIKRCQQLRGSVMMLGPLLARRGRAIVPKPGGDQIGRRRLDTHFLGMQRLGSQFTYDENLHIYNVTAEKLTGSYMLLDEASVTGTANIIMAAVLAQAPPPSTTRLASHTSSNSAACSAAWSTHRRHRLESAHHRGRHLAPRHRAHHPARHD